MINATTEVCRRWRNNIEKRESSALPSRDQGSLHRVLQEAQMVKQEVSGRGGDQSILTQGMEKAGNGKGREWDRNVLQL